MLKFRSVANSVTIKAQIAVRANSTDCAFMTCISVWLQARGVTVALRW